MKRSTHETKAMTIKMLKDFNSLPFEDQINFVGEMLKDKDDLFLSSVCGSVAHGIFNLSMSIKGPTTAETNAEVQGLWKLKDIIESVSKSLYNRNVTGSLIKRN